MVKCGTTVDNAQVIVDDVLGSSSIARVRRPLWLAYIWPS
jgi:hypothetical protein